MLQGIENDFSNSEPWLAEDMPPFWHKELHRFNWLRDFSANGTDAAKRHVRSLLTSWIERYDEYDPEVWANDVLARRLLNWLKQSPFLLTSNDGDFNYKFLKSLRKQHQHLIRYSKYFAKDLDQFENHLALYLGAVCFADMQDIAPKYKDKLIDQVDKVILRDGCHISRNPGQQLDVLADLISLRETFIRMDKGVPERVLYAIDRLAPAIRFFQHGDGDLSLFNGSSLKGDGMCDSLLAQSEAAGRAPTSLSEGGFERLKAGRSLLIFESGKGGRPKELNFHSGLGSFEFSHGRDRIIINCGSSPDIGSPWQKALAATAAHSTLSISDKNTEFPAIKTSKENVPSPVTVEEEGGNLWLDFNNQGYEHNLAVKHDRRIFLSSDGLALKGEDTVQALGKAKDSLEFTLRFHIHPDVSISRSMGGRSFLMMTKNGTGWQFLTSLSEASLEESIYCSTAEDKRSSQQIVLKGILHGNEPLTIKWALHQKSDSGAE